MKKFNRNNIKNYELTPEKEKRLFENAIIVFDTSALLGFYFFPIDTVDAIVNNVFKKNKFRFWVPQHVEYEFLKNREKVLEKPIRTYEALISSQTKDGGHLKSIKSNIDRIRNVEIRSIKGQLSTFMDKTKLKNRHPYLDSNHFVEYRRKIEELEQYMSKHLIEFEAFQKTIEREIKRRIAKVQLTTEKDVVLQEIENYFFVGEGYSYKNLEVIVEQGKKRYANEIPPGYKDEEEKIGLQIYGDLIIWNQIIDYSTKEGKSIILVTEDVKEDWWEYNGKENTDAPRHELLVEFHSKTSQEFWMYTTEKFLYKSNDYLKSKIKKSTIQDVIESNQVRYKQIELEWLELLSEALDDGEEVMPNHNYTYGGKRLGTWLSNVSQYNRKDQKLDLRKKIEELGFDYSIRSHDPNEISERFLQSLTNDANPIKQKYQTHFNHRIRDKKGRISAHLIEKINETWKSVFNEERIWTKVNLTKDRSTAWKKIRYDRDKNPEGKWLLPLSICGKELYYWARRRRTHPHLFHEIQHKFNDQQLEELQNEGFEIAK